VSGREGRRRDWVHTTHPDWSEGLSGGESHARVSAPPADCSVLRAERPGSGKCQVFLPPSPYLP
jgi:hypothetical protein